MLNKNFFRLSLVGFVCCTLICCKSRKSRILITENKSENTSDRQLYDMREKIPEYQIERIDEGIRIILNSEILFETNSSILSEDAKSSVLKLADIIKVQGNEKNILVNGYTDATGATGYNSWLSEKRASSVKEYLIKQGVKSEIKIRGYGSEKPIADNKSTAGRALNRRVEVILLNQ